ncbi:MAG: hypothetical protein ACLTSX_00415 [Collinsella sp.]
MRTRPSKFLGSMGDCELLVGAYPDYKVHVHSNTPNLVLEHMLQFGQVYEVFIHNMDLEVAERTAKIHADQEAASEPAKPLGFVAVAAGSGEAEILESLGVDVVVSGGQTMNPSTADLLEAVSRVNAESVIILPNNGNIRMAAEAAASACEDKHVYVVPTKTVPQAFSALFAVMPDMPRRGRRRGHDRGQGRGPRRRGHPRRPRQPGLRRHAHPRR